MRGPTVEISCKVAQIREKAIAVEDGTMGEWTNETTGVVKNRPRWYWLPKSQIEIEPPTYDVGTMVVVTMEERLAIEKELV